MEVERVNECDKGCPGAGKSTLGALLAETFFVQHISVGDLLRRIKDDSAHPQAEAVASMVSRQKLVDGSVLVPILKLELEGSGTSELRRAVLVDGFPRNLDQLRFFEAVVNTFRCVRATGSGRPANALNSFHNRPSFYSSTVPRRSPGRGT